MVGRIYHVGLTVSDLFTSVLLIIMWNAYLSRSILILDQMDLGRAELFTSEIPMELFWK